MFLRFDIHSHWPRLSYWERKKTIHLRIFFLRHFGRYPWHCLKDYISKYLPCSLRPKHVISHIQFCRNSRPSHFLYINDLHYQNKSVEFHWSFSFGCWCRSPQGKYHPHCNKAHNIRMFQGRLRTSRIDIRNRDLLISAWQGILYLWNI